MPRQMLKTKSLSHPQVNSGLRAYMLKVYNFMTAGLVVSALFAFIGRLPALFNLLYTVTPQTISPSILGWIVIISPLVLVFMFSSAVTKLDTAKAQMLFWAFSALMGLSMANILYIYPAATLVKVFLISAGSFAGLSLYGYTTTKDLSGMGAFLTMGLIGLIIAMLVNLFMQSPALDYALSLIGVAIFVGLTVYDTQKIKQIYNEEDNTQLMGAKAISGALSLYLDFINLFLFLLRIMGNRR